MAESLLTYVRAADALQQQTGDLCLPVKLTLGHPQLLLRLRGNTHTRTADDEMYEHASTDNSTEANKDANINTKLEAKLETDEKKKVRL